MLRRFLILAMLCVAPVASAQRRRPAFDPGIVPTWSNQVVRIFQEHCQSCHRDGGVGPFSLTDYETARAWAWSIRFVTSSLRMPPWKPAAGCRDYVGENRLGAREIAMLARWAEAGSPQGDPADLPAPLTFEDGWALGTPDLAMRITESYTPAPLTDTWRCFVVPISDLANRKLSALEFLSDHPDAVHHMIGYFDTSGEAAKLDALDPGPGYNYETYGLGFDPAAVAIVNTLGERPAFFPAGMALAVPPGADLVLQVHYHPHEEEASADQPRIGVHFAAEPVDKHIHYLSVQNPDLYLPAGDPSIEVTASHVLDEPITVIAVSPHMHYLGRRFYVDAILPDTSRTCLVRIEDWDQRWQGFYRFVDPLPLPAGSTIVADVWYDNSADNPANPHNPPIDVYWGEPADAEMLIAVLIYTRDRE